MTENQPKSSEPFELLKSIDEDIAFELFEDNGCDIGLEEMKPTIFNTGRSIETKTNSVLAGIIQQRIETKAIPLTLRKRLMYQNAIAS